MTDENFAQQIFDPNVLAEPDGFFDRLRREGGVHRVVHPATGRAIYVVTRYDGVREVLQSPERFSNESKELLYAGLGGHPEAEEILKAAPPRQTVLQLSDDPAHQRHRSLVAKGFTPSRVNRLGEFIDNTANELVDRFIDEGRCDFIEDFAARLPARVIASMLGFPSEVWDDLRRWSDAYLVRLSQNQTREEDIRAARDMLEAIRYFDQTVKDRRANPGDDLVTGLIQASDELPEPLNHRELLSIVEQMAIGGADSSRNTIAGAIVLFLQNPDQLALLVNDMSLIPNAVDEVLRYYAAVSATWKIARADTRLGDVDIPVGAAVMIRMDSANRDPDHFENAGKFDIRRPRVGDHLGLGQGIHYCLGQMLARRELAAALKAIFGRLKNVRIDWTASDVAPRAHLIIRATRSVFLEFDRP